MLLKKLFRTMREYKAQFISMIIMVGLGVGIFVGFNMEWVSIEKNTQYFYDLTHFADYRIYNENGFDAEDAEKIQEIAGVDKASRFLSVNVDVREKKGTSVALSVTEDKNVSSFTVLSGESYDENSKDGIWLSDAYALKNDIKIGDTITFDYKNKTFSGVVKGLIKSSEYLICTADETQLMPDFTKHGFAYISPAFLQETLGGFTFYPQINVISSLEKDEFFNKVNQTLGETTLILTKNEVNSYAGAQGEVDEGKTMATIMPVIFLLIAVLTMVTTMHRLTAKEKTQIGTLKALGFKDRRVTLHYTAYAFITAVFGCIIGFGLGYFVCWFIMNPNGSMGTYFDMPEWKLYMPGFCVLIVLVIIAAMTFIGFLSVKQMLKGTPAEALMPYTPKKMKKLVLEKTRLWKKFSFGTKWNLRDVMRHKSRSFMSLIGVIGCMVISVGAMGMSDTMNAFIGNFYDKAMNYSSHIYISETATDGQREILIERYNGDYSSSISVELKDKAVSLDIYNKDNDSVRFLDNNNNAVTIPDDGAYICRRISEQFGLKAGDVFSVSPYGQSENYEIKVAGVFCSLSENIVITFDYADKLGIKYTVDSVYTSATKEQLLNDIEVDKDTEQVISSAIKSVQSKQDIMQSFNTFMDLMNKMIALLIVAGVILGVVVLYNLGTMSYTERYREMATLKVVGFKDKKIGNLLIGQNLWISVVGMLIGLPLGIWLLNFLIKELASEYEMNTVLGFATFITGFLVTFGVSLFVSLIVAKKNKKIDMVEALKGAE